MHQVAQSVERRTIAKVSWRLLPLVAIAYCIAYIDRSNISVAALSMNKDLGFTAYIYGWGAGIFFFGYFLFEIPSNLILERAGARLWIARIMITWGIISGLTAFVTGPTSFLVIRFLLGAAEAGFFPGMILYFTYWFPPEYRGRVISTLFIAQPVANALASIISGAILGMDGVLGFKGWQWIFILEAVPAVLCAFWVLAAMTDRPEIAKWLAPEEKTWLQTRLGEESRRIESAGRLTLLRALSDPRVLALSMMYFMSVTANYGIVFFMPQLIKRIGLSNAMTGVVSSVPIHHRHHRPGRLGLVVGSQRRAALASHRRVDARRRRPGVRRLDRGLLLGAARNVGGYHRHLRLPRVVLADAVDLPHRYSRGRRDRDDQCRRQPWRLCRPLCCRLDQGFDRQFPGRLVFPCSVLVGMRRNHVLRRACVRRAGSGAEFRPVQEPGR